MFVSYHTKAIYYHAT